jgi:ankyrin repeat protein
MQVLTLAVSSDGETQLSIVQALLMFPGGTPLNVKDVAGWSALSSAVSNGLTKIVEELLKQKNIDINAKAPGGFTPLISAVGNGQADIVQLLLDACPDVSLDLDAVNDEGNTALLLAVDCNTDAETIDPDIRKSIVRKLLDKSADTSVVDRDGKTACDIANANAFDKCCFGEELLKRLKPLSAETKTLSGVKSERK